MNKAAVFGIACAAFFAGLFVGSRFIPSEGAIGCGNNINWYITSSSKIKKK